MSRDAHVNDAAISEALADASANRRPVALRGGGVFAGMQRGVIDADELDLRARRAVLEYEPRDLTIAVECGVTAAQLEQTLRERRQFLPLDAPNSVQASVGGILAAGWSGPRRHRYGRPRDLLIGSAFALADGTLARAGGMVVKNVAGYDLSRLFVGSLGTLAVLLRANFKALPLPECTRIFLASLPAGTRERAFAQVRNLRPEPAAAWWIAGFSHEIDGDAGDDGRIAILLECESALLERATLDWRAALGRAGIPETRLLDAGAHSAFSRLLDAPMQLPGVHALTYRSPSLPSRALDLADAMAGVIDRFEMQRDLLVDIMNGDVTARASGDAASFAQMVGMLDDALHDLAPRARILAGGGDAHDRLDCFGLLPSALSRMRALKERFDPHGILNPGVAFFDGRHT
ncbi:MAG: FAD-binding oxidoreductase [Candidatus Eremiobacteraeota bacterium]|nr:FAD-binding oxidoreductase [Candidatus Eremiobacteraeota bacterium]